MGFWQILQVAYLSSEIRQLLAFGPINKAQNLFSQQDQYVNINQKNPNLCANCMPNSVSMLLFLDNISLESVPSK